MFQYFLDDFGNFGNLVKIWTRRHPNYYQNAWKRTRKICNHPGNMLFMSIWDSSKFENLWNNLCPMYNVFRCTFCVFLEIWVHIFKIILRRWRTDNDQFSINEMYTSLDMNFTSIKNMNWKFGNFSIFR